jgi:hypothetical protein
VGNILLFGLHSNEEWWVARRSHIPVTTGAGWWVVQFYFILYSVQGNLWRLIIDTFEVEGFV